MAALSDSVYVIGPVAEFVVSLLSETKAVGLIPTRGHYVHTYVGLV